MDERENLPQEELQLDPMEDQEFALPKARIAYVLAIVAVLCGGNGIGIVSAGLFWKATGNTPGAVLIAAAVTVLALIVVAVIVLVHHSRVKKRLNEGE